MIQHLPFRAEFTDNVVILLTLHLRFFYIVIFRLHSDYPFSEDSQIKRLSRDPLQNVTYDGPAKDLMEESSIFPINESPRAK
jgi:hypothetical protein